MKTWQISKPQADKAWNALQDRDSYDAVCSAMMILGEIAALDMLDNGVFSRNDNSTILIPVPEGRLFGLGMGAVLKGYDLEYLRISEREGVYSANHLQVGDRSLEVGETAWIGSPVNGENLRVGAAVDYLQSIGQLDTIALSHVLVNNVGKNHVQTKIDDWAIQGLMNCYADAGEHSVSDLQDEWMSLGETWASYGIQGADESGMAYARYVQEQIKRVKHTGVGATEYGKGVVLDILAKRAEVGPKLVEPLAAPSWPWLLACLNFLEAKTGFRLGVPDVDWHFELLVQAMVHDQLLVFEPKLHEQLYMVTARGRDHLSRIYGPTLDERHLRTEISKELRWLLVSGPTTINNRARMHRR